MLIAGSLPVMSTCQHFHVLPQNCFAESVRQERDSLANSLNEVRHDTSRKMADMQQRFDHVYAMMQDCQVFMAIHELLNKLCMLLFNLHRLLQTTHQTSTREECARLNGKLEVLEQRQAAAAQQISDGAHTQSVHAKQIDRSMEEHQHRLLMSINKAESRGRETAEQIAQQAVSDAQTGMQVY